MNKVNVPKCVVKVKCVQCGKTRDIHAGEVDREDFPMCDKCFMPMIPVSAKKEENS